MKQIMLATATAALLAIGAGLLAETDGTTPPSALPTAPPTAGNARYTTQLVPMPGNDGSNEAGSKGFRLAITDHQQGRLYVYHTDVGGTRLLYSIDLSKAGEPTLEHRYPARPTTAPADTSSIEQRMRERARERQKQ